VRYRKPDRPQTDKRGFKTKCDAEIFPASDEVAKMTGRYIDPGRSRVTVGEWMAIWLASRSDLRRSTFDRVEGAIRNHIVPEFGPVPIAELTRPMCQQFAAKMNVTHKPGSVRTVINVLSVALQLAVDDGRLAANPAHRLKLPRQMKRLASCPVTRFRVAAGPRLTRIRSRCADASSLDWVLVASARKAR